MMLDKKTLRQDLIKKREAYIKEGQDKDEKLFQNLISFVNAYYQKGDIIYCYISKDSEADTLLFLEYCLALGYTIAAPKVEGPRKMSFYRIGSLAELTPAKYGILEPFTKREDKKCLGKGIMIVPGLGFTKDGKRIGYGGGFYDSFLSDNHNHVLIAAIGYQMQMLDDLPMEDHDYTMDVIITEENTYTCNSKRIRDYELYSQMKEKGEIK